MTVVPLLPPVTPPTAAWDAAVLIVAGIGAALAGRALGNVAASTRTMPAQARAKARTQPCPLTATPPPPDPKCKRAADTIDEVLNGKPAAKPGGKPYKSIKQRFKELEENPRDQDLVWQGSRRPPQLKRPTGSDVMGHIQEIENQQTRLLNAVDDYFNPKNNCARTNLLSKETLQEAFDWWSKDPVESLSPKQLHRLSGRPL